MQWLKEKETLEELINQGVSYEEIGRIFSVSGNAIRRAAIRIGIKIPQRRKINPKETFNKGTTEVAICQNCGKEFIKYLDLRGKFCCIDCFNQYKKQQTITKWKNGEISGTTGYTCSKVVRNYMLEKANYKCQKCGWGEENPYTHKIPLQIHHIDGNSLNNSEDNLQVLCPNCHSLTDNYGSRNSNAPRGKSTYYGKAKAD